MTSAVSAVSIVTNPNRHRSVLVDMAERYGMEPAAFEATLRATVVPRECTREQFAAFLLVAKEYGLNPLTKEIYAFPAKGGGIVPVLSIDGWVNLINSHKMMDGVEFDDHVHDGEVIAITCRIWRKDRTRPIAVTEYLAECKRQTDTWRQWPRRMLRHKAMIQAGRYAFGFSGIYDQDEAEPMKDVTPPRKTDDLPPPPPTINAQVSQAQTTWPMNGGEADRSDEAAPAEQQAADEPREVEQAFAPAKAEPDPDSWAEDPEDFVEQAKTIRGKIENAKDLEDLTTILDTWADRVSEMPADIRAELRGVAKAVTAKLKGAA